jgi:ribose-phosphate pyrophosphokinase
MRFENAEICVHVDTQTKNENCAILASISPPDEQLLFTLLLAHTLEKEGARRVAAILPYLAYTRHDKNRPGENLATAWVGELMRSSGIDEVITVDVHSERAMDLFPSPCFRVHRLKSSPWLYGGTVKPGRPLSRRMKAR